ncbi:hypothetical protein AUJ66_03900 [Candidatus Desantisbacteria bacterium CG1_02_38_46]|uniref:Creatininase n=3 Tax=unclassified Candidatus Desantisiibacteriota TaxID=3106372 RepID=A0A2H9P9F8_9BACT|nr:MAG: hypothetical protein AUJ66_03900 [Candidatus Desantisbacteria bacterium CG1_02_38_46]PIU51929.1 MAG: hypothetical protein COS91_01920 [Candidatus Desantisbacteria bacterium CG07_land_8_20_14_0_80_39_15]PIZ14880.1 MAG: hypothetical protein COY51_07085 [Candidatus Desantisbacteria bacterium CG_4_10_14_0_8_um_filter_39_17]
MKLEEMKPGEIDEMLKRASIIYIPWGALEWHGVHNPIGLDTIKAYHLCLEAIKKTGGAVHPPIYCGYQTMKPHAGFKKTIEVKKEVVQALAREYFEQLYDEGFRIFVVLMGHYGPKHIEALREIGSEFAQKYTDAKILMVPDYELVMDKGIEGDHVGAYETSLLMYFRPDLVNLNLLPKDREITVKDDGISGMDPRKSTREEGKRIADLIVGEITGRVQELMKSL